MGTISRPNSPLSASDGYAEVDSNESTIYTLVNGNINYENIASNGIRNANIDKDEVFVTETWDNILSDGHFPVWSDGTSSAPDGWTKEGTPTIARADAPTYAPSTHYSCKITGAGAANEGIYQTIALRKNATYTVSLKVKVTSGDTAVVTIVDGDGAEKASEEYTDTSWQTDDNKKYFTFTTGTTTNAGAITVKLLAKADTDEVWFGEVQVTEGEMAKGYQFISTNADTVDTYHATDGATDAKLLTYSGIPRNLWVWGATDANKSFDTITTGSSSYTEVMEQYIYLPAKTVDVEIYAHGWVDNNAGTGRIQVKFGATDTVELSDYFPDTTPVWINETATLTVNASSGGWQLVKVELKELTGAYNVHVDAISIAYK